MLYFICKVIDNEFMKGTSMIKMYEVSMDMADDGSLMRDIHAIVGLINPTIKLASVSVIDKDDEDAVIRCFIAFGTKQELKITKNTINKIEGILESYSFPTMTDRVELIDITLLK